MVRKTDVENLVYGVKSEDPEVRKTFENLIRKNDTVIEVSLNVARLLKYCICFP